MELEHSFTVPVPKNRAWDVLLDVERVAPCMPGATLDSVDGDEIRGRIKVKVGPINMMYAGTARFIEKDADAGVVTLEASGKETRGAGTASASVHSVLEDRGEETHVKVRTTLNVTGKPAQFGRGVMNEVGGKLLSIFATNLAATIARDDASAGAAVDNGGAAAAANGAASQAAPGGAVSAGGGAAAAGAAGGTGSGSAVTPAAGTGTPVEELKLPNRATTSLQRADVRTAGQLAAKTENELLAIDGIGPASLVDIKAKLGELGLSLAGSAATATTPAGAPTAAAPAATGADSAAPTQTSSAPAGMAASAAPAASAGTGAHHQTPIEAAHQLEEDALNLLKVAGLPVLKRAAPVLAALAAALAIVLTRRIRRRKR
jgi:carbon monoxide dehydrogenase subunit G